MTDDAAKTLRLLARLPEAMETALRAQMGNARAAHRLLGPLRKDCPHCGLPQ